MGTSNKVVQIGIDDVAAALWPEIGTDYTWSEALARASGEIVDDEHSQLHHVQATEYARDLARAAMSVMIQKESCNES